MPKGENLAPKLPNKPGETVEATVNGEPMQLTVTGVSTLPSSGGGELELIETKLILKKPIPSTDKTAQK